ncbi:general transcription factor II-I repeat domain-containing protein 2-like [Penaeus monodon]|nr:general transcription factor II-I repeat domain-containing protein 2-like [Penaeus monodon]
MRRFKDKITELLREFEQRFQIFGELEKDFKVFCSPFSVNTSDLPVNIQLEIIDLQCDSDLKGKFAAAGLDTFYQHLLPGYPNLTALAAKVLCMFGTTYLSALKVTDKHLNDILKLAATQDVMPNIDALVKEFSANLKCFVKNIICDVFRMYQSKTKETHLKLSLFLSYTMILPVRPTWE